MPVLSRLTLCWTSTPNEECRAQAGKSFKGKIIGHDLMMVLGGPLPVSQVGKLEMKFGLGTHTKRSV